MSPLTYTYIVDYFYILHTILLGMLYLRFVVVCGDGEYIVYTAMALRNKSFGQAQEFVWSHDSSQYAIREGSSTVQIFKNFKEQKSFKPDFGAEGTSVILYLDQC